MLYNTDVTAKGTRVSAEYPRELFLSAEDWTEGLAEAYKGVDDVAYLRLNGVTEALGPTGGDYNVLVTPDGDVFWVQPDCRHYKRRGDATLYEIPITHGTTQGMRSWDEATRTIVWMDDVLKHPRPIVRAFRHRGYTFGQDPDSDRILAQKPDGSLWVVADCYTPDGARGRLTPNGAVCAISLPSTPHTHREFPVGKAPYFVEESAWRPWTPPIIVASPPPAERPTPRRVAPIRHLELIAEPEKPRGTGVWSWAADVPADLPVMEGIGRNRSWIDTVPAAQPMVGVWWTRDEGASEWDREESEREAKKRGVPNLVYADRLDYGNAIHDCNGIESRGGKAEVAHMAYSFDNAALAKKRIENSLKEIPADRKITLIGRCDQTTNWAPDAIDAMLPMLVELANDDPRITRIMIFNRGGRNNAWPANRLAWWTNLLEDNPAKVADVPPVVGLPAADKPADSGKPSRPWDDGTNGNVNEWAAVGVAAATVIAAFPKVGRVIAWPFKKLKFW